MLGTVISFVGSKVGRLVAGVLGALATVLLVFNMGKREAKQEQKLEDVKGELKARRAVDEVDTDLERDARIKRLRRNGNVRKD